MLVDTQRKRILLNNGDSLVSEEVFIKNMLSGSPETSLKVLPSYDSQLFNTFYGKDVSSPGKESPLAGVPHVHTQEEFEQFVSILLSSSRYDGSEEQDERISTEIAFFTKTQNIKFLLGIVDLVKKFEENQVVWGVGRGSACASLVLYLIKAHDVDPLLYEIPFSELSKEQEER